MQITYWYLDLLDVGYCISFWEAVWVSLSKYMTHS